MGRKYHYHIVTSDGCNWHNWIFADNYADFWIKMATMIQRVYGTGSRDVVSVKIENITD